MVAGTSTSTDRSSRPVWLGWPLAFIALCTLPVIGFLLLPWSIEEKSLAVLHGLCAQQPTHTFHFGDARLPFDARMSGIYGGFAMASIFFLLRGRWGHSGIPKPGVVIFLAFGVLALGIDGVNSTLLDMGFWHLYQPMNEMRLATGLLTGLALAVFVWLLAGMLTFRHPQLRQDKLIAGYGELAMILALFSGYALLVISGWEPLRLLLTALLITSAVTALTGLSLAFVLLFGKRENQANSTIDLAAPATIALLIAFTIMATTSGGRFLLEAYYGVSTTQL
jgi:uncharacterized membrane protein